MGKHEINYSLKKSRKECREKAIKYNQYKWPLAWRDDVGFYCVQEYEHRSRGGVCLWAEAMYDRNTICYVGKDGRFSCVMKKEYIKRFRLTDNQKQFGQRISEL